MFPKKEKTWFQTFLNFTHNVHYTITSMIMGSDDQVLKQRAMNRNTQNSQVESWMNLAEIRHNNSDILGKWFGSLWKAINPLDQTCEPMQKTLTRVHTVVKIKHKI